MALERAVLYGKIASLVETRGMFTCDVVPAGGDTQQLLWGAYMSSMITAMSNISSTVWSAYSYELQGYSAGHWVPYDLLTVSSSGGSSGDQMPNAVAVVLLGKALGLRHVGRKFVSPISEALSVGNSLSSGGITLAAACLLAYITPFTGIGGGTITPGVADSTGTFHPFVGGIVSSILGSIRRRKPGRGI